MSRNVQIHFRVTADEKEQIIQAAKKENANLTDYIIRKILRKEEEKHGKTERVL